MKKDLHPTYFAESTITCACGNKFTTGSTVQDIHTEICSNCHPFYTGKQKLIDTTGTVDRFIKKRAAAATAKTVVKEKKPRKARSTK